MTNQPQESPFAAPISDALSPEQASSPPSIKAVGYFVATAFLFVLCLYSVRVSKGDLEFGWPTFLVLPHPRRGIPIEFSLWMFLLNLLPCLGIAFVVSILLKQSVDSLPTQRKLIWTYAFGVLAGLLFQGVAVWWTPN